MSRKTTTDMVRHWFDHSEPLVISLKLSVFLGKQILKFFKFHKPLYELPMTDQEWETLIKNYNDVNILIILFLFGANSLLAPTSRERLLLLQTVVPKGFSIRTIASCLTSRGSIQACGQFKRQFNAAPASVPSMSIFFSTFPLIHHR